MILKCTNKDCEAQECGICQADPPPFSCTSRLTGSILEVELAKQIEKSPEYYVCPYTGNKIEN